MLLPDDKSKMKSLNYCTVINSHFALLDVNTMVKIIVKLLITMVIIPISRRIIKKRTFVIVKFISFMVIMIMITITMTAATIIITVCYYILYNCYHRCCC